MIENISLLPTYKDSGFSSNLSREKSDKRDRFTAEDIEALFEDGSIGGGKTSFSELSLGKLLWKNENMPGDESYIEGSVYELSGVPYTKVTFDSTLESASFNFQKKVEMDNDIQFNDTNAIKFPVGGDDFTGPFIYNSADDILQIDVSSNSYAGYLYVKGRIRTNLGIQMYRDFSDNGLNAFRFYDNQNDVVMLVTTGTTSWNLQLRGNNGKNALFRVFDDDNSSSVNIQHDGTDGRVVASSGNLNLDGTYIDMGSENQRALIVPTYGSSPPTSSNGMIFYNTATNKFRAYENGGWVDLV